MIAMVLFFLAVTLYGNTVLTGVAQEKSTRVAEVLLARMRPRELLAGKVLGIGALGLGQFALIIATAGIALTARRTPPTAPQSPPTVLDLARDLVRAGLRVLQRCLRRARRARLPRRGREQRRRAGQRA